MFYCNAYASYEKPHVERNHFAREYGEDVAALFGISRIAANDVTLKPSLMGIEVKVKESVSPAETAPAGKCPPVHRHTS